MSQTCNSSLLLDFLLPLLLFIRPLSEKLVRRSVVCDGLEFYDSFMFFFFFLISKSGIDFFLLFVLLFFTTLKIAISIFAWINKHCWPCLLCSKWTLLEQRVFFMSYLVLPADQMHQSRFLHSAAQQMHFCQSTISYLPDYNMKATSHTYNWTV